MRQVHHPDNNVLASEKVSRLLIQLSLPILVGTAMQAVYNIVDTIFVGQFIGRMGMAALSLSFPFQMLTMGVGQMAGLGGASLISRLIGRVDRTGAQKTLGNGITFGVLASLLLMVGFLPFLDFWLRLIGASEAVLPYARDFLSVLMLGTVFNVLSNAIIAFVRAEGNARVAMTAMIISSLLNILLDWLFIVVVKMGVRGAALATVISMAVATGYALFYYGSGSAYLKLHRASFVPDFGIFRQIFTIGIASFVQTTAGSISAMMIMRTVAYYGGDLAISAFLIIQRVMWFSMIPSMVIGQGMQPILGYNYGARRFHLVVKTIGLATAAAIALGVLEFLLLYFFPEPIFRVFTRDGDLIAKASYIAKIAFFALPVFGFFNVGSMVFPSVGRALATFVVSVTRPVAFMIPLLIILPRFFGELGVWACFPGSDVLSTILVLIWLIYLVRELKKEDAVGVVAADTPADAPLKAK